MGKAGEPREKSEKKTLAGLLTILSAKRGMSQAELARQSGVSKPYINQLFRGTAANPSANKLIRIAAPLGVEPARLLDASEVRESHPTSLPESLARFRDEFKKQNGVEIPQSHLVDMARRMHSGPTPRTYQEWMRFYLFCQTPKK